jgi:hypothetical protein
MPYVGKLMRHTAKAVRKGLPADRVFAITRVEGKYLVAWKCDELADGRLLHPAFKRPLKRGDMRLFRDGVQANGSEPSAMFKPDSFYQACE